MIRSTKTTIKYTNTEKLVKLQDVISEYRRIVSVFIDELWTLSSIPKYVTSKPKTWLSSRLIQCAGKQAIGIVKGVRKKQDSRLWRINDFHKKGKIAEAEKLQSIYDSIKLSKPIISNIPLELDSRFVKFDFNNSTNFDGWVTLSSLGRKLKLHIPIKKTKHFNKYGGGTLKSGIRLSEKDITFMFEVESISNTGVESVGIDIGQNSVITVNSQSIPDSDNHLHSLKTIAQRLSRRKKGSKRFKRSQEHRKNFINWTINQLNLKNVKEIVREDIKNLRKGKKSSRSLSHWTYTYIFRKLDMLAEEQDVLVTKVNPAYTSQKCSSCGLVDSGNRNGLNFKCKKCNLQLNADKNASINISRLGIYSSYKFKE